MISQAELRLGKVKLDQLPIDLSNTYASGLEDPGKFTWKRVEAVGYRSPPTQ